MKKRIIAAAALMLAFLLTGCGSKAPKITMDMAKVTLGNYTGIEVSMEKTAVTDEEINSYAEWVISNYNQNAVSSRTIVEDGDAVYITIFLYDENGTLLDDGNGHEGYVYVGSGTTYEELEQGLIGAETKTMLEIPITFPDPYEFNKELSGIKATASVGVGHIKETEELSLDTLTDEQARNMLGTDSVEEFYRHIRDELEEYKNDSMQGSIYDNICDYLLDTCEVEPLPDLELKNRVDKFFEQIEETCTNYYNMTLAEYCEMMGMTEKEYRADIEASLTESIKLELIFTAIGDAEGIQYDEAEYRSYIDTILNGFTYDSEKELYEEYGEDHIKRSFRIERIIDWLIDNADIVYITGEQ